MFYVYRYAIKGESIRLHNNYRINMIILAILNNMKDNEKDDCNQQFLTWLTEYCIKFVIWNKYNSMVMISKNWTLFFRLCHLDVLCLLRLLNQALSHVLSLPISPSISRFKVIHCFFGIYDLRSNCKNGITANKQQQFIIFIPFLS